MYTALIHTYIYCKMMSFYTALYILHHNDDVAHVQRLGQTGTSEDADSEENIRLANDLRTDLRTQPLR